MLKKLADRDWSRCSPDWIVVTPKRAPLRAVACLRPHLREARKRASYSMTELALPLELFAAGLASGLLRRHGRRHRAGFSLLQGRDLEAPVSFNAQGASRPTPAPAPRRVPSDWRLPAAVRPGNFLLSSPSASCYLPECTSGDMRCRSPRWRKSARPSGGEVLPLTRAVASGAHTAAGIRPALAWGWLPCGLVYGALAAAVFSGGAARRGAMAAFGASTLPWL